MSYQDGMAALNLEMPSRVPRTEYSAAQHWELVKKVTGIDVNAKSSEDIRQAASNAFKKAWDYSFSWNVLVHVKELDQCRTQMGHAVFAAEGTDYSNQVFCPFEDVEEDLKKQTYNPFKDQFKEDNFQDYCFKILEMMISRSSYYFEKLPLIKNIELLRNIIYSGIWTKFELIKKRRMEEQS